MPLTVSRSRPRSPERTVNPANADEIVIQSDRDATNDTDTDIFIYTISTTTWRNLYFNGVLVGEFGINSALCGHYNVPVALITGDDVFVAETRAWIPDAAAVVVKDAQGHRTATGLAPTAACEAIAAGAREAVRRIPGLAPLRVPAPLVVGVGATGPALADLFALPPFVRRTGATTVEFDAASMADAVRLLNTLSAMSSALR